MSRPMKDSGVEWIGDIPEGWSVGKLKHFAKVKSGTYIDKNDYVIDGKYDIVGSNGKIGRTNKFNNAEKVITTGRVGTIGTAYIIEEGWITDNALVISTNAHIQLKYAYYVIPNFDFSNLSTGTAQPLITGTSIKNVKIPCPASIEEQQKIAAFLDNKASQIDSIIENTKQSIIEFKKYKQALITEAVTEGLNSDVKMKDSGIEWIGEIPEHWGVNTAKRVFRKEKRPIVNDEIVTAFRDGEVTQRRNRRTDGFTMADKEIGYKGVKSGDLVIHAMDAFAGAIGVSDSPGKCSPVCSICTPIIESNSYYYAYLLRTYSVLGYIESMAKGIRERSTDFRYATFAITPLVQPPIHEQQQIVDFLDEKIAHINALIADKEKMVQEMEEYKKALIYEYVTGKKEV